jgi:hypothetical protein
MRQRGVLEPRDDVRVPQVQAQPDPRRADPVRECAQHARRVGEPLRAREGGGEVLDRDRDPEPLGSRGEPRERARLGQEAILAGGVVGQRVRAVHDVRGPDLGRVGEQALERVVVGRRARQQAGRCGMPLSTPPTLRLPSCARVKPA